ncbi:alpha/beta fold hydrolase [Nocardia crassostreae]|uniref:alpha/beta fold hydrolase n=1 Tax=Nocardia crassostreae TaxID=53428 RepID=UPI001C3FB6E8|nr:alpha/beta fold hydrolase [Nocardia crassostreae]
MASGPVEYRLDRRGHDTVAIFHGGHMRAEIALGEQVYADAGYTVLVPSRPGYGRTPITTGTTPAGFADVFAELCAHLGVRRLVAVVGISAGARTAITVAARHRTLVSRLILESAQSFAPWPDRRTRFGAQVVFHPAVEKATWALTRTLLDALPQTALRSLLGSLTGKPVREVVSALTPADRAAVIALLRAMRSGTGFLNDLRECPDVAAQIAQPALVIASRNDGAVPFAHSEMLAAAIPRARLLESVADSHLIWFSADYPDIAGQIERFLAAPRSI